MRSSVCPRWLHRHARAQSGTGVEDLKGSWLLKFRAAARRDCGRTVRTILCMHVASELHS